MEKVKDKDILVISNNPFSSTENNGKTLSSIFKKCDSNRIHQLYFENSMPTALKESNFHRITDQEMLYKFLRKKTNTKTGKESIKKDLKSPKSHSNIKRLFREFIWSNKRWLSKELDDWLEEVSPEIVFFMAGDSGFAFNITNYIVDKYNAKLITYVTDDYILPIFSLNIFQTIRRRNIRKKMKKIFLLSEKVYTISPAMKEEYKNRYNLNSEVLANITNYDLPIKKYDDKQVFNIVYAGGLHYGRLSPILEIAKTIKKLELNNCFKINVYTNTITNEKKINKYQSIIEVHDSVSSEELINIYRDADLFLHVESFKQRYKKKTKLSLSTKIPEYILSRRPILAYGPSEISSMIFLKDISIYASKKNELEKELLNISKNPKKLYRVIKKSIEKYNKEYKAKILKERKTRNGN